MILLAIAINEDGIYDTETYTVSCMDALQAGNAFAANYKDTAVGYDRNCEAVFHALSAGIISGSGNIWDLGECTPAQMRYAVRTSGVNGGLFISNCCGNIKLIPFSAFGHQLTRNEESLLSESLSSAHTPSVNSGKMINSSTLTEMYCSEVRHRFSSLKNAAVRINSSNPVIRKIFSDFSGNFRNDYFSDVTFNISDDGFRASAYSCESGFVFYEKLVLLCCTDEFEKGNDIALPHSFPVIADKLASEYNQNIYRYDPYSENAADISRKEISLEFPFLYDAASLVYRITRMIITRNRTLKELLTSIPDFTTTVKYVNINSNPDETIHNIQEKSKNDVCCSRDDGRIIARKSKSGKNLILYAESYSSETADELCANWLSDCGIR